jgi:hypothetical protein
MNIMSWFLNNNEQIHLPNALSTRSMVFSMFWNSNVITSSFSDLKICFISVLVLQISPGEKSVAGRDTFLHLWVWCHVSHWPPRPPWVANARRASLSEPPSLTFAETRRSSLNFPFFSVLFSPDLAGREWAKMWDFKFLFLCSNPAFVFKYLQKMVGI